MIKDRRTLLKNAQLYYHIYHTDGRGNVKNLYCACECEAIETAKALKKSRRQTVLVYEINSDSGTLPIYQDDATAARCR